MKHMKPEERISMTIDKELLKWIDNNPDFNSRSHAIRMCILTTKRIYDEKNPNDMMKYYHGITPGKSEKQKE